MSFKGGILSFLIILIVVPIIYADWFSPITPPPNIGGGTGSGNVTAETCQPGNYSWYNGTGFQCSPSLGGGNLTLSDVVASIGNWSFNQPNYVNQTYGNATYLLIIDANTTISNWINAFIANSTNYTLYGDDKYIIVTTNASGDIVSLNETELNKTISLYGNKTYVPYIGATQNLVLGEHNFTLNGSINWLEQTGIQKLFYINPLIGDGFSMEYRYDFEALNDDWLVFLKQDGNDATPDGGIAFMMANTTNNWSVLKIDGYQLANFTNYNILTTENITALNFFGNLNASYIQNPYWYNNTNPLNFINGTYGNSTYLLITNFTNQDTITREPTGFIDDDRNTTILSFNTTTRNFTLVGTYNFYINGTKYTKTNDSLIIDNITQMNYIFYTNTTLTVSTTPWHFESTVQVATIYWNSQLSDGLVGDERHGLTMDWKTHEYLHETIGARYYTGFGGSFNDTGFSLMSGEWYDDDNEYLINNKTTCNLIYRNSSNNAWILNQTQYYYKNATNMYYDNNGVLTAVGLNQYMAIWFYVTNDINSPIYCILGQQTDTNLAAALANNIPSTISFNSLPVAELKSLYRVIIRNDVTPYESTGTVDYRAVGGVGSAGYVATSHGTLSGLTADDHPQYLLTNGLRNLTGNWDVTGWNITASWLFGNLDWSNITNKPGIINGTSGTNGTNGSAPNITSITWTQGNFSILWSTGQTTNSTNLTGPQGTTGTPGSPGNNGTPGSNGTNISITSISWTQGNFSILWSNGNQTNSTNLTGPQGPQGIPGGSDGTGGWTNTSTTNIWKDLTITNSSTGTEFSWTTGNLSFKDLSDTFMRLTQDDNVFITKNLNALNFLGNLNASYITNSYWLTNQSNINITTLVVTSSSRLVGDTIFDASTMIFNVTTNNLIGSYNIVTNGTSPFIPYLDKPEYFATITEDFLYKVTASTQALSPWFFTAIVTGTIVDQTGLKNHPGIGRVTTSASATSGISLNTNALGIRIAGGEWSCHIFSPYNTSAPNISIHYYGFQDTLTAAIPVDGIIFEINDTILQGVVFNNSVRFSTTTNYTVSTTTSQYYKACLYVDSTATSVRFELYNSTLGNTSLLWTDTITNSSAIPVNDARVTGHGYKAWRVGVLAALTLDDLDYMAIGINRSLVR